MSHNGGAARASAADRRPDHPADRLLVWDVSRQRADGGAAAVHRRRGVLDRVAALAQTMRYTVVLTAEYPSIALEILAPLADLVEHPTEHERGEDDVITILSAADAARP